MHTSETITTTGDVVATGTVSAGGVAVTATGTSAMNNATVAGTLAVTGASTVAAVTASGTATLNGSVVVGSTHGYKETRTRVDEVVVIAAAATSVSVAAIPAGATVHAVSCRVTTAIPTATVFDVGLNAGDADAFCNDVTVAINSTGAGNLTCPLYVAASTLVLITPDGTPANNAGRVRLILDYSVFTPPTS
jgi:hypothetical protein